MKILNVIAAGSALVLASGVVAKVNLSDTEISGRLEGTWASDPRSDTPFVTIVTYKRDGTGVEYVRPKGAPESSAVRVTTAWSVHDGVLTIKSITSSNPEKIPVGIELKDRIIAIDEQSFTFEAYDGYGAANGKVDTRVRWKQPNKSTRAYGRHPSYSAHDSRTL